MHKKFYNIGTCDHYYKYFMSVIYKCSKLARVFVPGRLFHISLMERDARGTLSHFYEHL
jgi:hypothetical protein